MFQHISNKIEWINYKKKKIHNLSLRTKDV